MLIEHKLAVLYGSNFRVGLIKVVCVVIDCDSATAEEYVMLPILESAV